MPIELLKVSNRFERQYGKLSNKVKIAAKKKEPIFLANPFDPRLETHKLHGKDKELWAFSITDKYRIKFIFLNDRSVLFLEIGTHDIYN